LLGEFEMNARHAVAAARARVNGANAPQQLGVAACTFRWSEVDPVRRTDLQSAIECGFSLL